MPRDVMSSLVRTAAPKLSAASRRARFLKMVEHKAATRKPVKADPGKKMMGTLKAKRNTRLVIREAAMRKVSLIIEYVKVNGERKTYEVNPYSYRYKRLRAGYRKVLYAEDKGEQKQIKMFVLKSIQKARLTDRRYRPRWPVEIGAE